MASNEEIQAWQRPSPFNTTVGIQIVKSGQGASTLRLPLSELIENRKGNIHGGAIASLADAAMGNAIRSARAEELYALSTISMTINYLSPGTGDLTAEARCTKFGRSVCFASVDITGADGELVASATGAFKVIKARASD